MSRLEESIYAGLSSPGDIADFLKASGGMVTSAGKLRSEKDEGVVAHLFGIPVGFQFGTASGLTGVPGLLVDIVTDPTTYLGGVGLLSRTGRAARAGSKWFKFADSVAGLRTVSTARKAKIIEKAASLAHKFSKGRYESAAKKLEGLTGRQAMGILDDTQRLLKTPVHAADEAGMARQIAKLEGLPDLSLGEIKLLRGHVHAGGGDAAANALRGMAASRAAYGKLLERAAMALKQGDLREWRRVSRKLYKEGPTVRERMLFDKSRRRDIEALIKEREVVSLAPTLAGQSELGQRSAITLQVPFTGLQKSINLPGQTKVFGMIDKLKDAAPSLGRISDVKGLVRGGQLSAKMIKDFAKDPGVTPEVIGELARSAATLAAVGTKGAIPEGQDFRGYHEIWLGEKLASKDAGKVVMSLFEEAVPTVEGRFRVAQLLDEPGKHTTTKDILGHLTEEALSKGFQPRELELAQELRSALEISGRALESEGLIQQMVKDYAPRIVKKVKDPTAYNAEVAKFAQRNLDLPMSSPHFLERSVPFLRQLLAMEKKGIIEVEKDFAKVLGSYFQSVGRATANRRFIQNLEQSNWVVTDSKGVVTTAEKVFVPYGKRVGKNFVRSKKAQELLDSKQYVHVKDILEIQEHAYRTPTGALVKPYQEGLVMHHEAASRLRSLFKVGVERPDPGRVYKRAGATRSENFARALLALNGFAKRGSVGMPGGFHFNSLTASASVAIGWPFLVKLPEIAARAAASPFLLLARKIGIPIDMRTLGEELRAMQRAYPANDVIERAARAGLQTGGIIDAERDIVVRATKRGEELLSKIPMAGKVAARVASAAGEGVQTWDRFLWDSAHSGYKLWTFNELYHAGLQKFPHLSEDRIAKSVADHVNNAFGGQLWEKFFMGRRGQQLARAFLLAPDWTLSNIRIATDAFANWFLRGARAAADLGLVPGRAGEAIRTRIPLSFIQSADVRAAFARRYALRVGLINYTMAELANFAMSGNWMDENPKGHRLDIATPFESENGRPLFWSVGKQFKEPFEWLVNGQDLLNYKLSPAVHGFFTVATKRDIFGRDIMGVDGGGPLTWAATFGHLAKSTLPIGTQRFLEGDSTAIGALREQAGFKLIPQRKSRGGGGIDFGSLPSITPASNLPVAF